MALARFKDLCINVTDARLMTPFWGAAIGLEASYQDNGDGVLSGATPEQRIWVDQVPEPRTVKQRVHLDLHTLSVADVEALGARRLSKEGEFPWTVLADPEGGELCVFVREQVPDYRLFEVIVDSVDPDADRPLVGRGVRRPPGRGRARVRLGRGHPGRAVRVDGLHPGARAQDGQEPHPLGRQRAAVQPLLDAGATLQRARDDEISWHVLADPEGNEFCVFLE